MKQSSHLLKGLLIIIIFVILLLLLLQVYIPEHLLLLELITLSALFFVLAFEATKKQLNTHAKNLLRIAFFILFLAVVLFFFFYI